MAVSAKIRKRQYEAALRREQYLKDRVQDESSVQKAPKSKVYYPSYIFKQSSKSLHIELQASERAITWLGGATVLGLKIAMDATDLETGKPRFWTPAKVHAGIGLANPKRTTTPWKTRSTKTTSASYSSPIGAGVDNATYDGVLAKATALKTARSGQLGDPSYAVFYVTPETYNQHL